MFSLIRSQSKHHSELCINRLQVLKTYTTILSVFSTAMCKGAYTTNAPALNSKPVKALVPPGKCQFTEDWKPVRLLEREKVSPTSSLLKFALPDESSPLNLSTCACILAKANINGEDVVRPYTPISTNNLNGCFNLLIKDYGENAKMSHLMCDTLDLGETVDFKHIDGNVKIQAPFPQKTIVMLVGGTGITPMIQALHAILGDEEADNKVVMLYGNKNSSDILGKTMIENWAKQYPDKLKLIHVLSEEPEDSQWDGPRGFIDKSLIEGNVPVPDSGNDLIFFICGPPPMYNALCGPRDEEELKGTLADMGYNKDQVYKF